MTGPDHRDLDPGSLSVFVDFDGTISDADTCVHLLDRLVGDSWHELEELYETDVIGSRECIALEWGLLPTHDEGKLRAVAGEVGVDPDLAEFAGRLGELGGEVTIVSDGYGFYAAEVGREAGVAVLCAEVDWDRGTLSFPFGDPTCACALCGTCKRAPVLRARERGRVTVFVGDGSSDRKVAPIVDILYAKDRLAKWCEENSVPYRPFRNLRDVASDIGLRLSDR